MKRRLWSRPSGQKAIRWWTFSDEADAYVVNTCSVTAVSDQKSRQAIHRVQKQHPAAVVAVCGCYPQTHAEDVRKLGWISLPVPATGRALSPCWRKLPQAKRIWKPLTGPLSAVPLRCCLPGDGGPHPRHAENRGRLRELLYLLHHSLRTGTVRSLPMEQAVEQTAQLAAEGYREIVLTGIEISSWGHDLKNGKTLIDLLEALFAAAPQVRLRLGSLEPRTITEDFCRRAAALPNLCPQFHLSMQSGCDATPEAHEQKV